MSDNALEIDELNVRYGDVHALKGVSIHVARQEIVALVGRSGAGKSSLVNAVMKMLPPSALLTGDIRVCGKSFAEVEVGQWRNRQVSIIPQDPYSWFNPMSKIFRQIDEVANRGRRRRGSSARVDAEARLKAVGLVDVSRVARSFPHELSGGMRQRVAVAASLVHSPSLVLADEPTSALDPKSRDQILSLLEECRTDGKGVLIISHDRAVVDRLADRIVYLEEGEVVPALRTVGVASSNRSSSDDAPVVLECKSVSGSYGSRCIFRDMSVEVSAGDTVAVVGESGIGKSTLCRIVAGYAQASSGSVIVNGKKVTDMASIDKARAVQMVFQDARGSLDDRVSIQDSVAAALRAIGTSPSEVDSRIRWALDVACFPHELRNRKPKHLSGGQVQRAALARAVAMRPKVLVLDEPFSALDAQTCSEVASNISAMQQEFNIAVLAVMHDVDLVPGFATKTVALSV